MKGRKPIPTGVKKLMGNPGKRPLNDREPKILGGLPTCPDFLTDVAKQEWRRVAAELHHAQLLTTVDRALMAAYCQQWAQWRELQEGIAQSGSIGAAIITGELNASLKLVASLRTLANELGLSPAARTRIRTAPADQVDELEMFLAIANTPDRASG